jgi:hypothetical protein
MYGNANNKEKMMSGSGFDQDALSTSITKSLELIHGNIEELTEYEEKLGTPADTRTYRTKMRGKIDETQREFKTIVEQIKQLEKLKDKAEKMAKRFLEIFNTEKVAFVNILKEVSAKEKEYVDSVRRETLQKRDERNRVQDEQITEQMVQEIAIGEEIIEERDKDIKKVHEVVKLMNDISVYQAEQIKSQGDSLEIVMNNINSSKENVVAANKQLEVAGKYERRSTKRNMWLCLIVLLIAVTVVVITTFVTQF